MSEITKTCKTCGTTKPTSDFHRKQVVNGKLYYRASCKDCTNAELRLKRQDEKWKSTRSEHIKIDRQNNPEKYRNYYKNKKEKETTEQRLQRLEYAKKYSANNKNKMQSYRTKTKIQLWSSTFYEKHKEKIKLLNLEYKKRNLDKCREWRINRERRVNLEALSSGIVKRLYRLQSGKCACCGEKLLDDFHVDHIIPLSKGGRNVDSNVQLLKSSCNMKKSSKDPIDYMQSKGYLL